MASMRDNSYVLSINDFRKHCGSERNVLDKAWNTLWEPFSEFPYATREDKAATTAALLTAVVRKRLPRAPAFAFGGPPAIGKTSLVRSIAGLAGGHPAVVPEGCDEGERRKYLLLALRNGQPSIILDNVGGPFGSVTLEECLTLDHIAERTIGALEPELLSTNILILIAGNDFAPRGRLCGRIVTVRIDPCAEYAERRRCTLDMRKYCLDHRQELVAAASTLLDGFTTAGRPRLTEDRSASFEQWDDQIRQCVLWLDAEGIAELGDPIVSLNDPVEAQSRI